MIKLLLKAIENITSRFYNENNNFKYNDRERGSALIYVFMILIILMILGMGYFSITLHEVKQAERHENRVQAYYYARSGAEKAFYRIKKGLNNFDTDNNYLKSFSWDVENNKLSINRDKYYTNEVILYNKDENKVLDISKYDNKNDFLKNINNLVIHSIGRIKYERNNTLHKKIKLNLGIPEPYNPPPVGEYDDNPSSVQEMQWTVGNGAGNSGVIDNIERQTNKSVVFRGAGESLKLNQGYAEFKAKQFYFDNIGPGGPPNDNPGKGPPQGNPGGPPGASNIDIHQNSTLNLYSDISLFYIKVKLKSNGYDNGKLCLNTSSENDNNPGLVYFKEGVILGGNIIIESGLYNFPNEGVCLPNDKDKLSNNDPNNIENWKKTWE